MSVRYQGIAISPRGLPVANANVAVLTQPANTNTQPGSPLATLATSLITSSGGANPFTADAFGNFFFYAAPGTYTIQIYGPQLSPQFVEIDVELPTDPGNVASKNFAADNIIYVSPNGNDTNDGLSWGTAKLTPQAGINRATNTGTTPGTVYFANGTYPGPTTFYQLLTLRAISTPAWGDTCGVQFCGPNNTYNSTQANVVWQYSSTLTIGTNSINLNNIQLSGIVFDFQNLGGGLILLNTISFDWDHFMVYRCGDIGTDCLVLQSGTGAFPAGFSTFHDIYINPIATVNHYATCLTLIGNGPVATGHPITDNMFYNLECAGQINNGIDFELNTDSNNFYGVRIFQTLGVAVAGSSGIVFNKNNPTIDQDAGNAVYISGVELQGPFTNLISMGQTTGPYIVFATGSSAPAVNVLGGTPNYTIQWQGLTSGTTPPSLDTRSPVRGTQFTGTSIAFPQFSALSGSAAFVGAYAAGRTAIEGYLGIVNTGGGAFFTDTAAGDLALDLLATGNALRIGTGAGVSTLQVSNTGFTMNGTFSPTAVNVSDLGVAALPFRNLWLGTAATNNTKIIGSATTAARNLTLPDADSITPSFLTCGTTSTCAKTNQTRLIVLNGGPIALAAGTLTVTALPFTSSTSYVCSADDSTGINGIDVIYNSGASVTFNGTGTDSIRYTCVGN